MAASCVVWACGLSTVPTIEEPIIGAWEWVESTGGIAGMTLTPASTGETRSVRFSASGVARLYVDGLETRAVGFAVRQGGERGSLEILYDEPLMGFESQTATFPSVDVLVLTDPCCDGFVSRFTRAP